MHPHEYHRILVGLDQALFAFHEAEDHLSQDDQRVRKELEVIRSEILKAESGHPFPFKRRVPDAEEADTEVTRAPWST
jgi:hypothetical protein